jgi:hypothetical protein
MPGHRRMLENMASVFTNVHSLLTAPVMAPKDDELKRAEAEVKRLKIERAKFRSDFCCSYATWTRSNASSTAYWKSCGHRLFGTAGAIVRGRTKE